MSGTHPPYRRLASVLAALLALALLPPRPAAAAEMNLSLTAGRAVPTASDSTDDTYSHLAGAFADGNRETAWISGRDQREHWARLEWRRISVTVTRLDLDARPLTIAYTAPRDFLATTPATAVNLTTTRPERLEVRLLADGVWRVLLAADAPAAWSAEQRLVLTPAQPITGVTEMRLSFTTATPDDLVALREIEVYGPKPVTGFSIRPKWQGVWIWGELEPTLPNFGPVQRFFRCGFEVKEPATVRSARLLFTAHDRGRVFLNGVEVARTVEAGRCLRPELLRQDLDPKLLRPGGNLLAIAAEDVEEAGLRGVLAELCLERTDGTLETIATHPDRYRASTVDEAGWNRLVDACADWPKATATGSPNQEMKWAWDEDYTPAYLADSAQIAAVTLAPPVPRPGDAFTLTVRVRAERPLSQAYGLLAEYGESGAARNTGMEFNVGDGFIPPEQGLPVGFQGERDLVLTGRWFAGTAPRLPLLLRLCNPQTQVGLLAGPVGEVTTGSHPGRLRIMVGAAAPPTLPAGFGEHRLTPDGRLQVDGQVVAPILFTSALQTPDRYQDWLRSGVRLFRIVPQGSGGVVPSAGAAELHYARLLSAIATQVETVRAMNPEARFLLMLDLDMPNDWRAAHPEEQIVLGNDRRLVPLSSTNHSLGYLRETPNAPGVLYAVTASLTEFVTRLKAQPWAASIIGVVMAEGRAGENYWGLDLNMRQDEKGDWIIADRLNYVVGDFGLAARRSLRDWLRQRYGSADKLAAAWQVKGLDFEDVASYGKWSNRRFTEDIMWHHRPADRFMFRDRTAEGALFHDVIRHQNEARADLLLAAAAAVKQASDGHLLTGAYIGYVIPSLTNSPPGSGQHTGHMAIGKVLASPSLDFTVSPHFYHQRRAGDAVVPMGAVDSPRLHGKLWLNEYDSRTYLSPLPPKTFSAAETMQVLRKEFAAAITRDQGWWWLEFPFALYGPQAASWFADPAILRDAATMKALYERCLAQPHPGPAAEIAVIVNAEQMYYTDTYAPANSVHSALINYLLMRLFRLGAPFDLYLQTDLPELVAKGWHRPYRLMVFLNSFHLDQAERELLRRDLQQDGRTTLFLFAPGYQGNAGPTSELAVEGIEAVTGMQGVVRLAEKHLLGATADGAAFDVLPWWGPEQINNYGQEIGPVFYLDPAKANGWVPWATLRLDRAEQPDKVAVAMRETASSRVIYAVLPDLPQALLDRAIQLSGVHRYTKPGVLCWANATILGVHAVAEEKALTLTAKEPVTWIEPFERRVYARQAVSLTLDLPRGQTRVFCLDRRGEWKDFAEE
jgi:hypothetical protein